MAMRVRLSRFAERLVHQHDRRLVHQSTRQGRTLCHAAGKLMRIGLIETVEPDQAEHIVDRRSCGRRTACLQAKSDVRRTVRHG